MTESGLMKLGCAKVDITPQNPLPLAGFAHRSGNFKRVDRPLYARILFFGVGGAGQALIVSADLLSWGAELTKNLKRKIGERWGLDESQILLHGTHNHSGPQTSAGISSLIGEPDSAFLELLVSRVLESVEQAAATAEDVYPERGSGHCEMGIYRRKMVEGIMQMAPNPDGPVDNEVSVVRFTAESGKTKAVLVHYTCHPTVSGDNTLSSEYPGVAMDFIEESLGEGTVSAFLQGSCADVRAALVRDGNFYRGGYPEVLKTGEKLADEVLSVLARPMKRLAPGSLACRAVRVPLRLQDAPSHEDLVKWAGLDEQGTEQNGNPRTANQSGIPQTAAGSAAVTPGAPAQQLKQLQPDAGVMKTWSRHVLLGDLQHMRSIDLELSITELAEGVSLLAANAELAGDYGRFLKSRFGGDVLSVCYSNGMIGYVSTADQLSEGGYEAVDYIYYFGLPAPLATDSEEKIRKAMERLVLN